MATTMTRIDLSRIRRQTIKLHTASKLNTLKSKREKNHLFSSRLPPTVFLSGHLSPPHVHARQNQPPSLHPHSRMITVFKWMPSYGTQQRVTTKKSPPLHLRSVS